ncbi:hypothetical protein CSV79_09420 [Sporosarcina sp. P13]|uniref:hypothetical protein n=1 Tax=Sporosarcina sp. P13 TaxID=2048263 RepID=UPI000C1731FA|nr:hypothetical protein [Sporosarcina sp. P13]PIC63886.1 hypothetical protein CSV79_09420 [Sporosarcina sp. P13]
MKEIIEKTLKGKNIKVTQSEVAAITAQWESFQKLKSGFDIANLDESDIALTHNLGSDCRE